MAETLSPRSLETREGIRVAFVLRTLSDRAISRLTLALATELGRRGHEVAIVCFGRAAGAPDAVANAQLVNLDTGKQISALAVKRLRRWILQWHPNVLFCQGPGPGRAAVLARSLTGRDIRIAVVDHNPPWTRFSRLNLVLRKADVLAAPTRSAAMRLSERTGAEDVAILPDPILGKIEREPDPPHPWYSETRPVICSVANIIPRKGQDTLIRALGSLDARLVLVGRVDDDDYLASLQELADELGVLDRVWFAGYQEDPLPFMYHAHAFVLASRSESFGMVLAEAMSCGTPVVATDCPDGPHEVLDQGRAGLLVPVDDPVAMAAGLRLVLEDEATRQRMIQAGRRKTASLSVERVADRYLTAIDRRGAHKHREFAGFGVALPLASLLDWGGTTSIKTSLLVDAVSGIF